MTSLIALLPGCATVPKEAAVLSVQIGADIEELFAGYRRTIIFSFSQMRAAGLAVIDHEWTPAFLQEFTVKGRLMEFAREGKTEAVDYWSRAAVTKIEEKRRAFLDDLEARQTALLNDVDAAFARVMRANATLTAQLNSVLKVQDLHNQVLEEFDLTDVRDRINDSLAGASNFVADFTRKIASETAELSPPADDTPTR